jgi:putative ABC transport system permease protein
VGEEVINEKHTMMSDVYGLDDLIFQKISVIDGELDLDKFKTGDYIVAGCFVESNGTLSCYDVGDKVKIVFDNGEEKEYTVLAIGDIPYDVSMRRHYAYSADLYLPSQEWLNKMKLEDYYVYAYDVDDGYKSMWNNNMSKLIQEDDDISYESKMTYENQFEGYINAILTLGICVSIILGVIGLLNFINSIYNSIHNRKRELAIMQSMGMSRNQIYGSLIFEGGYYMLISLAVGIGVGVVLNYLVVTSLGNAMEFIIYKGSMLPYVLFGIVGCLIAVCIPIVIFYALDKKEDLLYRLHKKV